MFKVGQKVKVVKNCCSNIKLYDRYVGNEGVVTDPRNKGTWIDCRDGENHYFYEDELELITNQKEVSMPPIYILKKETPEFKKETVFKVGGCYQNGDYWYEANDKWGTLMKYDKQVVEKQPDWFEKVELVPIPSNKLAQVKKILKGK